MRILIPIMLAIGTFIGIARAAGLKSNFKTKAGYRLLKPGAKLALFGSSSAAGLFPHMKILASANGSEIKYTYSNGTTVSYWISRIRSFLESIGGADIIFIVLGGNDSRTNFTQAQHSDFIDRLLTVVSEYGQVYWILPLNLPWEDKFSPIVMSKDVFFFETYKHDIPMQPDKIHATPSGYQKLAALVWNDLERERHE
jgi:lysophospholipase L1-like esterase